MIKERPQRRVGGECAVEVAETGQVVKLFIAIQRAMKVIATALGQHRSDLAQTRDVLLRFAVGLQLEVAQAIGADGFIQRMGQPIVQAISLGYVSRAQGIAQAHGVPHLNVGQRLRGNDIAHTHA